MGQKGGVAADACWLSEYVNRWVADLPSLPTEKNSLDYIRSCAEAQMIDSFRPRDSIYHIAEYVTLQMGTGTSPRVSVLLQGVSMPVQKAIPMLIYTIAKDLEQKGRKWVYVKFRKGGEEEFFKRICREHGLQLKSVDAGSGLTILPGQLTGSALGTSDKRPATLGGKIPKLNPATGGGQGGEGGKICGMSKCSAGAAIVIALVGVLVWWWTRVSSGPLLGAPGNGVN